MRVLLEDSVATRFKLVERDKSPDGRTRARGIIQRFDTLNGNKRVYPKTFFESLFRAGSQFMERISRRACCGHIEHPSDGLPDLRKFAVVLTDVGYVDKFPGMREELKAKGEDPDTAIIGEFEALPTPDGKIVEALWEAEVETGASSRAQGSVVRNEGSKYPQYPSDADIVQDDVDEDTIVWDIVARPSTPDAFPRRVMEAINEAQETRRKELKEQEAATTRFSSHAATGDTAMDLTEIRTRLSRLQPKLESLSVQPKTNLTEYLKELDVLNEALERASRSLTDSADSDRAATMKGSIQHHRDQVVEAISAAIAEADSGKLPGAKGLSVPKSPSIDELDVLPTVGKKGQNLGPGGAEGQGHIEDPDGTSNDGTPPGPGVKPGVKVPAGPTGQAKGKVIGTEGQEGDEANLDEEGAKTPKKIPGAKGTKVGYQDTSPQTSRRGKKANDLQGIVASEETDGDEEVVQEMGMGGHPMRGRRRPGYRRRPNEMGGAGYYKRGMHRAEMDMGQDKDEMSHGEMDMDNDEAGYYDDYDYEEMGDMDMESLANLNTGLVNENRGLRRENVHIKKQLKQTRGLVVETGKRYREEQFKTVMERLIEANMVLDTAQCRVALESATDPKHMVSLAEAMLGARVRMHNEESVDLDITAEEDGFYRLLVNGEAHHQIFDGETLYQRLQAMGIEETEIEASFAKAHGIDYKQTQKIAEQGDEVEDFFNGGDDDELDMDFGMGDEEPGEEEPGEEEPGEEEPGEEEPEGEKFVAPPEMADAPDAQPYMMVPMQPAESKGSNGSYATLMERLNRASGGSRENLTESKPAKKARRKIEEAILPVGVRPKAEPKKPPQMGEPAGAAKVEDGSTLMEAVIARKNRGS